MIDLERLDASQLPSEVAVTSITMAELAAGPHATRDAAERARRQDRLQRAEAAFDPIPFDAAAARAYGRIYAAVVAQRRKARGAWRRLADRSCRGFGRSSAVHRNPDDFAGLEDLVAVVAV